MLKINTRYLSILKHRFDEQISESDILAWLYNFEEEDWESALILLNNICYYSEKRCCAILEYGLSTILKECSDLPIFFSSYWRYWKKWRCDGLLYKKNNGQT